MNVEPPGGGLEGTVHHHRVEIVAFERHHQADVQALLLGGLAERWGELDPTLNRDLDDIATTYAHGRVVVATSGGVVVGTGTVVPIDAATAEIVRMSVAPSHRRDGVGRVIVDALVGITTSWHAQRLICETSSHWTSAVAFYLRCGFEITHESVGEFGSDTYFTLDLRS